MKIVQKHSFARRCKYVFLPYCRRKLLQGESDGSYLLISGNLLQINAFLVYTQKIYFLWKVETSRYLQHLHEFGRTLYEIFNQVSLRFICMHQRIQLEYYIMNKQQLLFLTFHSFVAERFEILYFILAKSRYTEKQLSKVPVSVLRLTGR